MSLEDQLAARVDPSRIALDKSLPDNQARLQASQEALSLQNQLQQQQIDDLKSARAQRETYAGRIFALVFLWIICLFVLLLAQGFCPIWRPLSDKVLIALITSTTANLIGTLIIVLKYIFRLPGQQ